MKKLSIVIPMYNSFHLMKKNLLRLNAIKDFKIEVVIVDDCSSDNSFEQAQDYKDDVNYELVVVRNMRNLGPGCSRNKGIDNATGDYITFVDSDDYLDYSFEKQLGKLFIHDIDCIVFDYLLVDCDGNKIGEGKSADIRFEEGFIDKNDAFVYVFGSTCGKIYKKKVIDDNSVRFGNLFRNEDMPFTKKALAVSKSIYYLPKKLYMYVQVSSSLMHTQKLNDEKNCQIAYQFLIDSLPKEEMKEELEAIELREVLNNSIYIMMCNKESTKKILSYIEEKYSIKYIKNQYFKRFPKQVKIITFMAYFKLVFLLRLIFKIKNKLKSGH